MKWNKASNQSSTDHYCLKSTPECADKGITWWCTVCVCVYIPAPLLGHASWHSVATDKEKGRALLRYCCEWTQTDNLNGAWPEEGLRFSPPRRLTAPEANEWPHHDGTTSWGFFFFFHFNYTNMEVTVFLLWPDPLRLFYVVRISQPITYHKANESLPDTT